MQLMRYVILEHDHPVLHWDLMLEAGEVLQTWRLAQPPAPGVAIEAIALGDHRLAYLHYEGPVSGNRGFVKRWDIGEFTYSTDSRVEVRHLVFRGERVNGEVQLSKLDETQWRFTWSI
jgi:hypothetical protein